MAEQRPDRQPPRKQMRPNNGPSGMKFGRGVFGWVLFIGLAIMLFVLLRQGQSQTQDVSWSELREQLRADRIKVLTIETDQILGEYNTNQQPNKFRTPVQQNMVDFNMLQWLTDH